MFDNIKNFALECEKLGYDSIWMNDHVTYGKAELECWTTLSALASVTSKIRLGTLVTCNAFRLPSLLAKMSATLDFISEGRLELGLGAGWSEEEHRSYGIPFPKATARVEKMKEGIEIIKRLWTQEKANYEGKYYAICDAVCEPKPLQKPHPPITIGGGEKPTRIGEEVNKVQVECANRINFRSLSVEEYRHKMRLLEKICSTSGRNFQKIEKSWLGQISIYENMKELEEKMKKIYLHSPTYLKREAAFKEWVKETKKHQIIGTVNECLERIEAYIEIGVTYFIGIGYLLRKNNLELLAREIISHVGN